MMAVTYTNSSLAQVKILSPNYSSRTQAQFGNTSGKIDKITIHHMACNGTIEAIGRSFADPARGGSSNYGIGSDGRIALYVEEKHRAWTSSSGYNDCRAVTIEVANDGGAPDWHVGDTAIKSLIALCVDICKRNGIKQLNYTGDANGNLTRHNMFAATACPGPYLQSKFSYIAEEVNKQLIAQEAKNIKAGSAVKILPGAAYVSGKSIPEYIREKTWYVKYVGNGNACLGWSTDNKYNLFTEVPIKYLEAVSDPNKIVAGVGVRILPGATYPSGKEIPLDIRKKWWYVKYVSNGKACLDWSVDGTQRLFTEIPIKYLERYPE